MKFAKMRSLNTLRLAQIGQSTRSMQLSSARRQIHATPLQATDGVFKELTEMRVRTPWVEALRKRKEGDINAEEGRTVSKTLADRALTPKKMSDSYHRVVCILRCNSTCT